MRGFATAPGFADRLAPTCAALAALALAGIAAGGCGGSGNAADAAADAPGRADGTPDAPTDGGVDATDAADAGDLPPGIVCALAVPVPLPGEVTGDTTDLVDFTGASCSSGADGTPQMFFAIAAGTTPTDVVLDVAVDEANPGGDPPFDAVVSARSDCTEQETELACADSGFGEHLELLAVSGDISVIVDGTPQFGGAATGAFTLRAASRKIRVGGEPCDPAGVASRCATGLRCALGTCVGDNPARACELAGDITAALASGPLDIAGMTRPFAADQFQGGCAFDPAAGAPEDIYRIDVAVPSTLDASTDHPDTRLDTVLYLRGGDCPGPELACQDDVDPGAGNFKSHLIAPALAPGRYYLLVDGASSASATGAYRLQVSLTPL